MRRGFALYVMMAALALLAAFSLVASRVVAASMRLTRQAQEAQASEIRLDGLVRTLREDVWGASALRVVDENVLRLTRDGQEIVWTFHADATVTREGAPAQRWTGLGQRLTIQRGEFGVVLHVGDDEAVLVSQVMLANGER